MPGFTDCKVCFFRDRPEVCHALTARFPRLCDLIAMGRDDYRELVRRRTLGLGNPPPTPRPTVEAPPPAVQSNDVAAFDAGATRAILACNVRGKHSCGCTGMALCHRAGLPAERTWAQCLACIATSRPVDPDRGTPHAAT